MGGVVDHCVISSGPPRMSPKSQRTPRAHRVQPCRTTGVPAGMDFISHSAPGDVPGTPPNKSSPSGGTWSSVVSGGRRPGLVLISLVSNFSLKDFHEYFDQVCQINITLFSKQGWKAAAGITCISFLAHRPRSPRQNSLSGASAGPASIPSSQTGNAPVETVATPTSSSPTAASPSLSLGPSPAGDNGEITASEI